MRPRAATDATVANARLRSRRAYFLANTAWSEKCGLEEAKPIDEYRIYFRPVVLGRGKPFFAGSRAAAPPCGQRFNPRARDQVDVRSCLSGNYSEGSRRRVRSARRLLAAEKPRRDGLVL